MSNGFDVDFYVTLTEAMAAGCVVVGDRAAFNGIQNFVVRRDGLIAESSDDFLICIRAVLADLLWASEIGENASKLIRKDFSWSSRLLRAVTP